MNITAYALIAFAAFIATASAASSIPVQLYMKYKTKHRYLDLKEVGNVPTLLYFQTANTTDKEGAVLNAVGTTQHTYSDPAALVEDFETEGLSTPNADATTLKNFVNSIAKKAGI